MSVHSKYIMQEYIAAMNCVYLQLLTESFEQLVNSDQYPRIYKILIQ